MINYEVFKFLKKNLEISGRETEKSEIKSQSKELFVSKNKVNKRQYGLF